MTLKSVLIAIICALQPRLRNFNLLNTMGYCATLRYCFVPFVAVIVAIFHIIYIAHIYRYMNTLMKPKLSIKCLCVCFRVALCCQVCVYVLCVRRRGVILQTLHFLLFYVLCHVNLLFSNTNVYLYSAATLFGTRISQRAI